MTGANDKTKEYLRTQIQTASREQLVLMLYDGAIRFSDQARDRIAGKDFEGAHRLLIRAQNIVLELLYALDRKTGGEVADNLASLYTYCYNRLVEANVHHLPEKIDESNSVLKGLRDAWVQAMEIVKKDPSAAAGQGASSSPGAQVSVNG
ncbi:MAG: flagellar export chaperone FliS [Planctomycetota bacterium]